MKRGLSLAFLLAIALSGCGGNNPPQPPSPAVLELLKYCHVAAPSPETVTAIARVCLQKTDFTTMVACVQALCGDVPPKPTPTTAPPRPSAVATAAASATPTGIPTAPPAAETPIPIGGDCSGDKGSPAYFREVRTAIAAVEQAHRDWFLPDRQRLIHVPRLDFDFEVEHALRGLGLDAAVDNCGGAPCDELAVAKRGDASFHEQYGILVSSGDVRDPINGDGYRTRCVPRGWTPGAAAPTGAPTTGPAPTPVIFEPPDAKPCPCLNHINIGPLGQAAPPYRPHPSIDGHGVTWQCYAIDTTPRFNPNGNGVPDNDDHPNYGGHCEYPGPPTWSVTGVRDGAPGGPGDRCEDKPKPGARPRCGYQYEVCGMSGDAFTITAWPPLPLTDLYGAPYNACAGGDGRGTFSGTF